MTPPTTELNCPSKSGGFSFRRFFRRGFPLFILSLLLIGYWTQREDEKESIESTWRHFLSALARDDAEGAYAFVNKDGIIGTIDGFKESRWFDSLHPWSLSVSNASVQLVSMHPNLLLTRATLRSSTHLDPFWEIKPTGIYTEVTFVKRGREWKVAGLPTAVAR